MHDAFGKTYGNGLAYDMSWRSTAIAARIKAARCRPSPAKESGNASGRVA
jgi:hypothetical protein